MKGQNSVQDFRGGKHTSDLIVLVFTIFNTGEVDGGFVWEDLAVGNKIIVTSIQNSVKHRFVEKEISHPFGYNDIDFWIGELHFFHLTLQKGDVVRHPVYCHDFTGLFDDGRHIHANNVFGSSANRKPEKIYNALESFQEGVVLL